MSTPVTNHDAFAEHAPEVLFRVVNRVALITLNRPAALNALSYPMIGELAALLERCRDDDQIVAVVLRGAGEKGFCAGGDVRALYRMVAQRETWLPFFVDEYRLDYAIHTFPKPVVALMDGVTMGGGMGLAQGRRCVSRPSAARSRCRRRASASCPTSARRISCLACRPNSSCTSG